MLKKDTIFAAEKKKKLFREKGGFTSSSEKKCYNKFV
jgi:hypothetical protein